MTFSEFIAEKGAKALAVVCEVAEPTAYSWANRNCIPRKRWDRLMEIYGLKYADLKDMENASRRDR